MSNTSEGTNAYLLLASSIRDEDERQDAYAALLEARPQTHAEALAIVKAAHHSTEWDQRRYRKHNVQLAFDPPAPKTDSGDGEMVTALDRLPGPDHELIRAHVIDGKSLRELAVAAGVGKDTIAKRYAVAADKLRTLVEKR